MFRTAESTTGHAISSLKTASRPIWSHAVACSIKLDDLREVEAARVARQKRVAPEEERIQRITDASNLGHELIDPATEAWLERNMYRPGDPRYRPDPRPPRNPDLLVTLLEATAKGCDWLADRWAELLELLDEKLTWGTNDEYKAIRLLGKLPEAEDNADVRSLRLAISVANNFTPQHIGELTEENLGRPVPTRGETKEMLREICNRHIARLRTVAAECGKGREDESAQHNFDATPAGKEVRRENARTYRELTKALDTVTEVGRTSGTRKRTSRRARLRPPGPPRTGERKKGGSQPVCAGDNPGASEVYLADRWVTNREPRLFRRGREIHAEPHLPTPPQLSLAGTYLSALPRGSARSTRAEGP